jgi:hypothetical protein
MTIHRATRRELLGGIDVLSARPSTPIPARYRALMAS